MGRLTTEVLPRERLALQPSGSSNGRGDPRGVWLVTAGIYRAVTVLATGERGRAFTAISPGILPPLAIMFAVLVGFLAAQDWGDFDRANAAVNREVSSLRAVVLLAAALPGEPASRVPGLVQSYIEDVTIAMIHSGNSLANRLILAIFSTSVGLAVTLLASHSSPFSGEMSVRPTLLLQVMPEPASSP